MRAERLCLLDSMLLSQCSHGVTLSRIAMVNHVKCLTTHSVTSIQTASKECMVELVHQKQVLNVFSEEHELRLSAAWR